ncbi:cadherin-like and PC-esterase domain-containing protein 1 [Diadema setosum]|uniref:cadherin-like and PC-esterase domain-containing protein 1 n=1 Tax=Diadema setosum TaxID=31175 RepID=UPI003B3A3829
MMHHCAGRLLRRHARNILLFVAMVTIISLCLSCAGSPWKLDVRRKAVVVVETNPLKYDRDWGGDIVGRLTDEDRKGAKEEDEKASGAYRNILEGVDYNAMDAVRSNDEEGKAIGVHQETAEENDSGARKDDLQRSQLYNRLKELEDATLKRFQDAAKVAVVRGEEDLIRRDLPLYRQALEGLGFQMKVEKMEEEAEEEEEDEEGVEEAEAEQREWEGWLLLLCLTFGDADETGCLQKSSLRRLTDPQKHPSKMMQKRIFIINRIPGLRNVLWRKDAFCYTMNEARRILTLRRSQLAPLCWVMPAQYEDFLATADALGTDVRWVFKSPSPEGCIQVLQPTRERDYARVMQYRSQRAVVQQYFPNPLLIFGSPVNIRAYVLVTGLNPLRAYIHSQGLVFFRQDYQKGFKKIPSRTWDLDQFRHHLVHSFGARVAAMAFRNMETVIVETLLVAEPSLVADFSQFTHPWEDPYRCEHCFQLLGFDIIFNSTLHPIVVEVTGQPHLQPNNADQQWAGTNIKQTTVKESMAMMFSTRRVAGEVADALASIGPGVGIEGLNCKNAEGPCLSEADLGFLMSARRESHSMGSFRQLYPCEDIEKYTPLLHDLEHFTASHLGFRHAMPSGRRHGNHPPSQNSKPVKHSTKDMHPIIIATEQFYAKKEREKLWSSNPVEAPGERVAVEREVLSPNRMTGVNDRHDNSLIKNIFGLGPPERHGNLKRLSCSEDRDTVPYLASLSTFPALNLTFEPGTTEYHSSVPYGQVVLQVGAFARSCDCEARLEDKYGVSRPANFTLGLGHNRINILVVDMTHSEPWVLNTYTLHIHRAPRSNPSLLATDQEHEVCTLVQDCELKFLPTYSCGLQKLHGIRWGEVVSKATSLPLCHNGFAPGQWLVPCAQCSDNESCDWERARWQPHGCRHGELTGSEVRQCLAGKKLLFLGDSTNRGMMYYLMERVNGSLYEWDKTHDTKHYINLNGGRTSASFSYYPQFWLPAAHRPLFDHALYQLVSDVGPLGNGSQTVLVVGGVHWLALHHLTVLEQALNRLGLNRAQVIVKGLGAGFHQPVDGIHCLTQMEQKKVFLHNQGLGERAVRSGFGFVDTFNMTMARYRDFLEGKCACHFHKVKEVGIIPPGEGSVPGRQATNMSGEVKDRGIDGLDRRYHVTGGINAIYSEILLGQICGRDSR